MRPSSFPTRLCFAILWSLAEFSCPCTSAQAPAPAVSPGQTSATSQPPYDRLELLGTVSATMDRSYLIEKIRIRGIDFTPDATFLQALSPEHKSPEMMKAFIESRRPGIPESPERHKAYLMVAETAMHRLTPAGKENYEAALAVAPNSAALHLAYAGALLLASDYPGTEIQERLSLELWSGDADAHIGLAAALTGQGREDEAVPEAREALRIYPNHKGGLVELGIALTRDR